MAHTHKTPMAFVLAAGAFFLSQHAGRAENTEPAARQPAVVLEKLEADAAAGSPASQFELARAYEHDGVFQHRAKAAEWYSKAASQEYGPAMCRLGVSSLFKAATDNGVPVQEVLSPNLTADSLLEMRSINASQDARDAANWFGKAAARGVPEAQYCLAVMLAKGRGIAPDIAEAGKWFDLLRKEAGAGKSDAQYFAALMHHGNEGLGSAPDKGEMIQWLRHSADQGYAPAQWLLGKKYDQGDGVTRNAAEYVRWTRTAAEQGLAQAQFDLAILYSFGQADLAQDYREAVAWCKRAALQGHCIAQGTLALWYAAGKPNLEKDAAEAEKWNRLAAEQGARQGLNSLGTGRR